MKLLYGTGNPAKLDVMRRCLADLGIELIGLKDLGDARLPEIIEDGKTPLENARKKAEAYFEALHMPVFSCDSGLYFDDVAEEDQPGVHVRTVNGKYLSDEEMTAHYANLAKKYGGLTGHYQNAISLILDETHRYDAMEPSMESASFGLVGTPHPKSKKGFPLDRLSIDLQTGKYYYDRKEKETGFDPLDQLAVESGFPQFFERVMKEYNRMERYEFRTIRQEEMEQGVAIELACFPPNEACSEKSMRERVQYAPELFLAAVDKETGKIAGTLNGLATNETKFRDAFFDEISLYDPEGENVMLLGLSVLPEYRGRGIARALMEEYCRRERKNGRKRLILTCLQDKVEMYQKMNFHDDGISASTWGGEAWHDMTRDI